MFLYARRPHFYETDQMGVVHHSNYLRYFEEARVAWLRYRDFEQYHAPQADLTLAVLETRCWHLRPLFLKDHFEIKVQTRLDKLRVQFQYDVQNASSKESIAKGLSIHVPLSGQLKVVRLPQPMKQLLENETWNETWLLNL